MLSNLTGFTGRLVDQIGPPHKARRWLTPLAALGLCVLTPAAARAQVIEDTQRAVGDSSPASGWKQGEPAPTAFNGEGAANSQVLIDFLNAYFANAPAADFNGDKRIDPQDVIDFLAEGANQAGRADGPDGARPDGVGPQPHPWCVTQERYTAGLIDRGIDPLRVVCVPVGVCDNPANRNAAIPTVDTPIKTYRLSIHVFCDDGGENCAATAADVATAVARLNADYAPWRIQFVYELDPVSSTRYQILDPGDEFFMKRRHADSPATKLNVYVVDTGGGSWGTFPWDPDALGAQGGIVMHYYWFVAQSSNPSIFTHEVGHCLGLWHTHHGVSEVPECGDCYEAAGRSPEDGDIAGDRCSDTNPSPTNQSNCFDPPGADPCSGHPWTDTPYRNYMSYSNRLCAVEFTTHQAGRMHCWSTDRLSGWLQLPIPPAAPGTPTLTRLSGGQVRVAWADNSNNEDGFRVQREKKQAGSWINPQIVATVGANVTVATDAPGVGTFRYRVQGFNSNGDSAWSAWKQVNN